MLMANQPPIAPSAKSLCQDAVLRLNALVGGAGQPNVSASWMMTTAGKPPLASIYGRYGSIALKKSGLKWWPVADSVFLQMRESGR